MKNLASAKNGFLDVQRAEDPIGRDDIYVALSDDDLSEDDLSDDDSDDDVDYNWVQRRMSGFPSFFRHSSSAKGIASFFDEKQRRSSVKVCLQKL